MITTSTLKLTSAAFATALFLAACGGGGGGDSDTSTGSQSKPGNDGSTTLVGVTPQTSVPAPTYDTSGAQYSAFQLVNNYRNAMGVGMLRQDPVLDTSAQAHSLYLFSNFKAGVITALDHNEIAGYANYYAATPLSRGEKAGAPATEWIAENIASGLMPTAATAGVDCINQFIATVYHLASLTGNQETIGIGYTPGDTTYPFYTCATDFGTSTGVSGTPGANSIPYAGGQQIPVGAVVHSPYANEAGVAIGMHMEAPNPASDLSAPGRPILVRANAQSGNTLTVNQFVLTDASGAIIPTRILIPASAKAGSTASAVADPNNVLSNGTAVLLPLNKLAANTSFTVTFSGARDGSAVSSQWSFTTGAN